VFHFLTDASQRAAYANALVASLKRGGIAIIASFAEDGPVKCSGLPIVRYAPKALSLEIDRLCPGIFVSIHSEKYVHVTPKGNTQSFQYSVFRKL
jgi:hypothetical protein